MKTRHIALLAGLVCMGIFIKQTGIAKSWFTKHIIEPTEEKVIDPVKEGVQREIIDPLIATFQRWNMDKWRLPNENLRYDQVSNLCSHNSFTYPPKWLYYQQIADIKTQLNHGVRALMPDTYEYKGDIYLCHQACTGAAGIQKMGEPDKFSDFLKVVKNWLDAHPSEIVTLIVEEGSKNYPLLAQAVERVPGLPQMVLSKLEYEPLNHDGYWPTLKKLKQMGKRLIIFSSRAKSPFKKYSYYEWKYIIESNYSSRNKNVVCQEHEDSIKRGSKHPRRLLLINYFGEITSDELTAARDNKYENLKSLIKTCKAKGLGGGKNPNFIALDRVDKGNAMKLINELNRQAEQEL